MVRRTLDHGRSPRSVLETEPAEDLNGPVRRAGRVPAAIDLPGRLPRLRPQRLRVAHAVAAGTAPRELDSIRGTALFRRVPDTYTELHADDLDTADEGAARHAGDAVIRLPSCEFVEQDREAYARASRVLHRESNPGNARPLVQRHGDRDLWLNPGEAKEYGLVDEVLAKTPKGEKKPQTT